MDQILGEHSDAEAVAHGIRLGSPPDAQHLAQLGNARTVEDLERATAPELFSDPEQVQEREERRRQAQHITLVEHVGCARLHSADEYNRLLPIPPELRGERGSYKLASESGWLPGTYADRAAALVAYGYILGGEHLGCIDDIRDLICREQQRPITRADIEAYAQRQERT